MALRRLSMLVLAGSAAALMLAGCGRAGDPSLPPGVSDSTPYPGGYPEGAVRSETPRGEQIFEPPVPEDPR